MTIAKRTDSNDAAAAKHYRWQELPAEPMKGSITRRLITGDRMMIRNSLLLEKMHLFSPHRAISQISRLR